MSSGVATHNVPKSKGTSGSRLSFRNNSYLVHIKSRFFSTKNFENNISDDLTNKTSYPINLNVKDPINESTVKFLKNYFTIRIRCSYKSPSLVLIT